MKVTLTIKGLETLRNFDRLAAAIRSRVLEQTVRAGATPILQRAQEKTPVRTGHLRRSEGIKSEVQGSRAVAFIGTDVDYAPYVEFGTSRMGAQPYLRPAFDNGKAEAIKVMERVFADGLAAEVARL